MKIIPAIDIIDGKCVRLTKGDYATQKIYAEDPADMAKRFEDSGIQYLHVVDLDGAKSKEIVNYKSLERIASKTNLIIDFGGGIKSVKDVQIAFNSGASKITAGSIAVKDRAEVLSWKDQFGKERLILGADCKNRKVATNGWIETSDLDVLELIEWYKNRGINEVICTDISKDGMLQGPAFELYIEILKIRAVELIASGGISSIKDLLELQRIGCSGAIIGKAIYEGKVSLKELEELC